MQLSRVYADAASKEPPEYTDYANLTIQYGYNSIAFPKE